ncbi:MAG: SAM-dependent chlorinase/fluorinase, partial [Balneolaceae bacterium]
ISHEIPPQDVMAGAWVVRDAAPYFPEDTIHLVVVDPGVGTGRSAVVLESEGQIYVGPDNGIFSLITGEQEYRAYRLTDESYWRKARSRTFHGRDVFAPVAAHLANGVAPAELGDPIQELVTYRWATPIADHDGIQGWVIHIDRFGNLITNIPQEMLLEVTGGKTFKIYIGNTILKALSETFAEVEEGDPVAYIGSSGMLEVAVNKGDAGEMLSVRKGAQLSIVLQK